MIFEIGYAMTFPLPTGNFSYYYDSAQTLETKVHPPANLDQARDSLANLGSLAGGGVNKINKEDIWNLIINWNIDEDVGYIFEIDIEVPENLHDIHNELPFLPERYNNRLTPTLFNKTNYRTHILNLKQAIDHGLKLTNVHKIISFTQKRWLKDYIEFNTKKRANTNDENMRNFYKLMNNAVYGKTMENIFKRYKSLIINVNDHFKIKKLIQTKKIDEMISISKNLAIAKSKLIPIFDKPIYIGFCILEISKHHMYFILYDVIKVKWNSSKLLYMDTDSFVLNINQNFHDVDYKGFEHIFDLSGYDKNSNKYNKTNKGILGTLKDEFASSKVVKFICLRSKCYIVVLNNGRIIIKNKGISGNSSDTLCVEDFENILENKIDKINTDQYSIKSFNHRLFTIKYSKKCLTNDPDFKRSAYINQSNNYNDKTRYETKALGHYKIKN
tara:strand:+ start:14055 stop:15383 length:1329 start_codon:yes stop_codon:yes gene_type:complete